MGSKRRNHSPEFKTQVALQALNGQKTLAEIADIYEVHPVQVCQWKQILVKRLPELYCQASAVSAQEELFQIKQNLAKLEVTNSKLNHEIDWLKKNFYNFNQNTLRSVIEPDNPLISLRRQCELLGITRSGYYYRQRPSSLHNQLCSMGFAAFERKLIKSACSGLVQIPFFPLRQEEAEKMEEQWIFDIAFWPCQNVVRFAALLLDGKSQRCLAWGLSDSPTPKLAIELLKIAMTNHSLPLILRSESYLPLFNEYFLRLLETKAISFMEPRWISQHKGPGRSTLLSPLWKFLKVQVRGLQQLYPDATSEWLFNKVIEDSFA